jgi:hypothetical protein
VAVRRKWSPTLPPSRNSLSARKTRGRSAPSSLRSSTHPRDRLTSPGRGRDPRSPRGRRLNPGRRKGGRLPRGGSIAARTWVSQTLGGLLFGQRRQQIGKAAGQHRLAGAGRPEKEQGVLPGRGDLEDAFGRLVPPDLREVWPVWELVCGLLRRDRHL